MEEEKEMRMMPVNCYGPTYNFYLDVGGVTLKDSTLNLMEHIRQATEKASAAPTPPSGGLTAELLQPYIAAGLLDENLQPPKWMSLGEMAVLAHDIAERFEMSNFYPIFEKMWGVNRLASYYSTYLKRKKSVDFLRQLKNVRF